MTHDRRKGIGATDARLIMQGDWLPLWEEKTGRRQPVDLFDIFRVQLGKETEAFHMLWIDKRQGTNIIPLAGADGQFGMHQAEWCREVWQHPTVAWLYATLDGWDKTHHTHVECKHSHSRMSLREAADYYMPQLQHQLMITGKAWCWFSVIPGNDEPLTTKVERDADYIARLLELEAKFWWHVTEDVAPEILPQGEIDAAAERVSEILVGGFKADLDMTTHNQWPELAAEYIRLKPQAQRFEAVAGEIKELLPPDRKRAFGHGVQVLRDKRGRVSLREEA